jgi:hypothetical protein
MIASYRNICSAASFFAIPAFCFALLSTPAKAGSIPPGKDLDFRGGKGGTFSYTIGSGDTATVKNAPENTVISFPSFLSLTIQDGTLDFTTGPCIATCGESTIGGVESSVPQFGQGGGLTLYGGIPSLGIPDGTALIDGVFVPFRGQTAVGMSLSSNPNVQSGMTAMIEVLSINPALLAYFNFNPSFSGGKGTFSDLLLELAFISPSWNGQIKSSDLLVDPALPEPPSLILLGSAMLFMAYLFRRRLGGNQAAGGAD